MTLWEFRQVLEEHTPLWAVVLGWALVVGFWLYFVYMESFHEPWSGEFRAHGKQLDNLARLYGIERESWAWVLKEPDKVFRARIIRTLRARK